MGLSHAFYLKIEELNPKVLYVHHILHVFCTVKDLLAFTLRFVLAQLEMVNIHIKNTLESTYMYILAHTYMLRQLCSLYVFYFSEIQNI